MPVALEESRLLARADASFLLKADPNMWSICEPLPRFDDSGLLIDACYLLAVTVVMT